MPKPRVPTSVTVISVLGLVFGAFGVFGLAFSILFIFSGFQFGPPNPMMDKVNKDPGYLLGTGISLAVGVPLLVIMLASAIGGLSLKPWARVGMLIYAIGTILNGLVSTVFTVVYVIPLMLSALPQADPATQAGATAGAYGGACGGLIGLIYPVCILWFYTRPHVKDAFNGIVPPSREEEFEDYDDRRDRPRDDRIRGSDDRFSDRP